MILALSTALDIRIIHSSFFTKPRILKGTIIDTKLVLNDSGHRYHVSERKRRYTKLYKIHTQQGDVWGENAKSYVENTYYVKDVWGEDTLETNKLNNELEIHDGLKINDNVIWFSFENNSFGSDGYIIKEN